MSALQNDVDFSIIERDLREMKSCASKVDDLAIIESYDSVGWLNALLVHRVSTWSLGETFTFTTEKVHRCCNSRDSA